MDKLILSACISLCSIQLARADVQTFINDYAGFAAAAGPLSVIDFETQPNGQPSQTGIHITPSYNYDFFGAHFSAPAGTMLLGGNPVGGFDLRVSIPYPNANSRTWIVADPLEPVYAAGAHFAGSSFMYAYDEADQLLAWTYFIGGGGGHFLGVISTDPIDYVVFDRNSYAASIDAFYFSPIPEPASAVLLAAGAGWLFRARSRASRVVPAN